MEMVMMIAPMHNRGALIMIRCIMMDVFSSWVMSFVSRVMSEPVENRSRSEKEKR